MYQIETRYEYWGAEGKTWTKWFISFDDKNFSSLKEAEEKIKFYKSFKSTKLKHEYKITESNV